MQGDLVGYQRMNNIEIVLVDGLYIAIYGPPFFA